MPIRHTRKKRTLAFLLFLGTVAWHFSFTARARAADVDFDGGTDMGRLLEGLRVSAGHWLLSLHPKPIASGHSPMRKHYPFEHQLCGACHDEAGPPKLREPLFRACLACHSGLDNVMKMNTLHAPFAAGDCARCHSPHESSQQALLREPAQKLCAGCHDKIASNNHPVQKHPAFKEGVADPSNPKRPFNCVSCHEPHGTNWSKLVRWNPRGNYGTACLICHNKKTPQ